MKKAFLTLIVIVMTAATLSAAGDKKEPVRYYLPTFTEGWFIDLAGTYSIFAAGGSTYHDLSTWYGTWPAGNKGKTTKPFIGGSAKIGKRMTPSMSLRLGYDLHRSGSEYNGTFRTFHYKNLHLDVMESPIDLLLGYNPERFFTIWVYGGIGLLASDKTWDDGLLWGLLPGWKSNLEMGFQGGFVNCFRITNSLDFHIDINATATRWSFDDIHRTGGLWHRAHFDFTAEAGIMWYVGGRAFEEVTGKDVVKKSGKCAKQEARIEELINQVTNLQDQLANCGKGEGTTTIVHDTIVKMVESQSISYPFSIFFNKGSYELRDGRDRVNLQEFAKAAKDNGYKVILRGTCDNATASSAFNKTLAEKRCNKIKSELVKLGVPENSITINAVGGVKELTPAEYDRRVIIQLSK